MENLKGGDVMEAKIMAEVYLRLHNFIYRKCGFSLPISSKGLSYQAIERIKQTKPSTFSADKIGNIFKGVSITNIKGANKLVIKHRVMNQTGRMFYKNILKGKVMGFVALNTGLPLFHIIINYNGNELSRMIMPQNPWRCNNNGYYSHPARAVQRGDQISWVMDIDFNFPTKNKYIVKITNGNIEYF